MVVRTQIRNTTQVSHWCLLCVHQAEAHPWNQGTSRPNDVGKPEAITFFFLMTYQKISEISNI